MKKRIIGGAIICAIAIPCFLIGGIVFDILACIVGLMAMFELVNANKSLKDVPMFIKMISLVCVPIIAYLNINTSLYLGLDILSIIIPIVLLWIPSLFFHSKGYGSKEAFLMIAIGLIIGILTNSYMTVFSSNKWILLYLIVIQVGTDVFAYLGGKLLGKTKFSKISPNKTIEGCVIGSLFGTALGFIYFVKVINSPASLLLILVVTVVLSIVGQMGDLMFSLIKRENDIKDFSNIIPGHGGICDRLDSLSLIILVYVILFRFL